MTDPKIIWNQTIYNSMQDFYIDPDYQMMAQAWMKQTLAKSCSVIFIEIQRYGDRYWIPVLSSHRLIQGDEKLVKGIF